MSDKLDFECPRCSETLAITWVSVLEETDIVCPGCQLVYRFKLETVIVHDPDEELSHA